MKKRNKYQGSGFRVQGSEKEILADCRMLSPVPCPLSPEEGFTLIELMVSTSILGLIGLAVLTTFGSGFHVYERVQSYGGLQADILLSLEEMERDLSNTFSFSGIGFEGEAQKIIFPAVIELIETIENEETILSSVGQTSYYLEEEDDQKILIRSQQDYSRAGREGQTGEDQGSRLAYVKDLQFGYYFFDGITEEYGWKDSWSEEEGLPAAVKIELTFEDRGQDIELVRTVFVPTARVIEEIKESEEEEGGGYE